MEFLVVLQARMSSTRLPGKVMADLNGQPMIKRQIDRIMKSKFIDQLVVATSVDTSDDILVDFLTAEGIEVYRGSLDNVYARFLDVAQIYNPRNIIRLTADCPMVMPILIDEMIQEFKESNNLDYLSNTLIRNYPDGLDIEILRSTVLFELAGLSMTEYEKEHVTSGIYSRPEMFKCRNFCQLPQPNKSRWTVDYQQDLEFIRKIYKVFVGCEDDFNYEDAIVASRENKLIGP